MLGRTANQLTLFTNNRVDFSRIGELASNERHRYSNKELAIRTGILITIAAFSLAGYTYNEQKKSGVNDISAALVMGLIGLVVGHIPAIGHLVIKRHRMHQHNQALIDQIRQTASSLQPDEKKHIHKRITEIQNFTLANEKHSKATLTLAHQRRQLEDLKSEFNDSKQPKPGI